MPKDRIFLRDFLRKPQKVYVRLNQDFLIELLEKASKDKKPHKNKTFCKKLGVKFNNLSKCSLTIVPWMKSNKAIPLDKLDKARKLSKTPWREIELNLIGIKIGMQGTEVFLRFPLEVGGSLGSIAGHILGDGSIDKKYLQVFYSNSNKDLLKEFQEEMNFTFGIFPRIWMQRTANFYGKTRWDKRLNRIDDLIKRRNCGLFYPSSSGIILNFIFNDFAIGKKKKITSEIKNSSVSFKRKFLRAFFDDEGTVGEKSLRVFQDKRDILEEIKLLLTDFEISTTVVKTQPRLGREHYYLSIHRKTNLIKFRENIGFTSKNKMEKLREICVIKNLKNSK